MLKHTVVQAIKCLIKVLQEDTLLPSEYILAGELLECHRQRKAGV